MLVALTSAGSTSRQKIGEEKKQEYFSRQKLVSVNENGSSWDNNGYMCNKCQRWFLISGLHGKCQAVSRKEFSNQKRQPEAESRWLFPGSNTILVLAKRPWIVPDTWIYCFLCLCVSPTSYIHYIPIYSRHKQWIGQMLKSTHKQYNIAETINMNWNACISCTLPKFYRKLSLYVSPAFILLEIYHRIVILST